MCMRNLSVCRLIRFADKAQPILDGVPGETGWSKHMPNLMELARETAIGLESRYNSTFWYPLARDTVAYYIEVRTICWH